MKRWLFVFAFLTALGGLVATKINSSEKNEVFTYVITETSVPTSLDPLDADNTNNLAVARMIYSTPLEASEENQLASQVLSSFKYDKATKTMEWFVKEGIQFSDGSPITADDIVFAVARMAYERPKFPVIQAIKGVQSWAESKKGVDSYPDGLTVSGNKISIQFAEDVSHPMFRFCLEIFSIIPKRCVDLKTNKLICDKIPSSGHYEIESSENGRYSFVRRKSQPHDGFMAPQRIKFDYMTPEQFSQNKASVLKQGVIVAGNEIQYSAEDLKSIKETSVIKFLPASRFGALMFNHHAAAFKDRKCRLYFANIFREINAKISNQEIEGSIFTKVLPGYESFDALEKANSLSEQDQENCRAHFAKIKIEWGHTNKEQASLFVNVLKKTLEQIGAKESVPRIFETRLELANAYAEGSIGVMGSSSGFWALDPAGDIKMLFTPNMHKLLSPITEDSKLQSLLGQVDESVDAYKNVNRYLFQDAKFNVYNHPRRFFVAHDKDTLTDFPFALTYPSPWQVFKVK